METAPEIIFHDVQRSQWIEDYIVERLERTKGNRYSVMIEVRLPPNHDLAAKKQRVVHEMRTQLPALINQAFSAIESQVKKTAQLRAQVALRG